MSIATYDGDWLLDGDLGHQFWNEVKKRTRVYWPHNTDAFIELYLDPSFGDPVRLRRTAGVKTPDGDFADFTGRDEDTWYDKSGIGYASFDWDYKYANTKNLDTVRFWGHVYSTAGTRFWFEAEEKNEGESVFMDRMRIPVPKGMVDEVKEWAASKGCEHLHTKGAVFERRFTSKSGMAEPRHNDVHIRCDGIDSQKELMNILTTALDFVERAARSEGA